MNICNRILGQDVPLLDLEKKNRYGFVYRYFSENCKGGVDNAY